VTLPLTRTRMQGLTNPEPKGQITLACLVPV